MKIKKVPSESYNRRKSGKNVTIRITPNMTAEEIEELEDEDFYEDMYEK